LRLLLIDQFGEMGGAQRCLLEAAMGFAARGWETFALTPAGPLHGALRPFCREIGELPCGPFASAEKTVRDAARFAWQLPLQAFTISRNATRRNIDLIYVNGPRVLPAAALGASGRPLIYHSHWMVPQRAAARLAQSALRRSSASAIATSRLAGEWLQDSVMPGCVSTIYNGIAGFGVSPRARNVVRHIAILGRISAEKGQLEFVRAAQIAASRDSNLRFTVCGAPMFTGDRYFETVRTEAAGLPVRFSGWTEDVGAFLADVDLLVVPSQPIDNIPRVILEAFAAGVAVVAFASGAIPELIRNGETGLLLHQQTPQALADAMLAATAQPGMLNRIAARAHALWRERYTLRRFQSEVSEAVEAALRRHHQRTPLQSAGASASA
jgi:glycosyltransferase involved in cell wall biosynthesis